MNAISESKRKYGAQDLVDYAEYHGVGFKFTSHFPIRSVLPLRVTIANPDDQLRQVMCKFFFEEKFCSSVVRESIHERGFCKFL